MSEKAKRLAKEFMSLNSAEQQELVQLIQSLFGGGNQRGGFGDKILGESNTINFAPGPSGRCSKCGK